MKKALLSTGIILILFLTPTLAQVDFEDDKPSFWKRVYFGGGMNLSFSRDITVIGASPSIGYMITPRLSAGFGITYLHIDLKYLDTKTNQTGWRLFGRYNITQEIFLYTEYEQVRWDPNPIDLNDSKITVPAWYAGGGVYYPLGGKAAFVILALYDLKHDTFKSTSREPFSIRAGITIAPF